jgi:lipoprotein NlpI
MTCLLVLALSKLALAQDTAVEDLLAQATSATERGDHAQAITHLTAVITKSPTTTIAWYLRGRANFCAGQIPASVADFDKYVQLVPQAEARQWERGIAYYYAGKFAEGAKQFELYQTFHDQDVENSAWRYLCVARAENVEKAQANMLPIANDRRVPMMQIYELYRGKLKPEDVLAASDKLTARDQRNLARFYAHLYIGLWHEVGGRAEEAKKHILEAEKHKIAHYMWDVAHVHAERLRAAQK